MTLEIEVLLYSATTEGAEGYPLDADLADGPDVLQPDGKFSPVSEKMVVPAAVRREVKQKERNVNSSDQRNNAPMISPN